MLEARSLKSARSSPLAQSSELVGYYFFSSASIAFSCILSICRWVILSNTLHQSRPVTIRLYFFSSGWRHFPFEIMSALIGSAGKNHLQQRQFSDCQVILFRSCSGIFWFFNFLRVWLKGTETPLVIFVGKNHAGKWEGLIDRRGQLICIYSESLFPELCIFLWKITLCRKLVLSGSEITSPQDSHLHFDKLPASFSFIARFIPSSDELTNNDTPNGMRYGREAMDALLLNSNPGLSED